MPFFITYVKNGQEYAHPHAPETKLEALEVGHELTRDHVADYFRVQGMPGPTCGYCPSLKLLEPNPRDYGDDWPRCPDCGAC